MVPSSRVVVPKTSPVCAQLPSFSSVGRCKSKSRVKSRGVVYTPSQVVAAMVEMLGLRPHHTVLEPSCGHGAFLFGLLEYARLSFGLDGKELLTWFTSKVTAIEISSSTISELRELLVGYFRSRGVEVSSTYFKNLLCLDSLIFRSEGEYDFCIGNPPYVRTKNLDPSYLLWLRKTFGSCASGSIDLYYAFIEKFARISNQLCFVTPNGFITSSSGTALRRLIEPRLTHLLDFKEQLIFPDARTYTCIFKITKAALGSSVLYGNRLDETPVAIPKSVIFEGVPACEASGESLGPVLTGLCTLCDAAFMVKKDGKKYFAESDGRRFEIEAGIVVPSLKLTKQRDGNFSKINYMLYPYEGRKIIPEADLLKNFPLAHAYLRAQRPILEQRDRGRGKYESWYAYGRKQGLHAITSNEVIAIPGMIGGACVPVRLDISSLREQFRAIVFTGGFIIPVSESNRRVCDAVFSSAFTEYTRKHGKPWAGSYYTLGAKWLRAFHLPSAPLSR